MPALEAPELAQHRPSSWSVRREAAEKTPNTKESVDAAKLRETVNVRNTEDALRYFPSLLVRKRHIGDTQAPLATRTSGVGASARSLIYADGVLLSALIGNNNSFASPRWGMVSPKRSSASTCSTAPSRRAYPGNAIGAVVNIKTRMPEKLEASATAGLNLQRFDQYGTHGTLPGLPARAARSATGMGPFSWFLSANHVDSQQPAARLRHGRRGRLRPQRAERPSLAPSTSSTALVSRSSSSARAASSTRGRTI